MHGTWTGKSLVVCRAASSLKAATAFIPSSKISQSELWRWKDRPLNIAAAEATVLGQHVNEPLYVDVVRSTPFAHRRTFAFSASPDKTRFFIND
jgi:hypothetical protein